ncbi:MAG: nucleotide exchange factor GrpE [Bacteroidota bacterium]|nr:nucleotide exchange factor GrpE [Bacteroidota bacterium]MDQ3536464.1 nucleotide exchange factor GrpE [Bacteroidota bacterium]
MDNKDLEKGINAEEKNHHNTDHVGSETEFDDNVQEEAEKATEDKEEGEVKKIKGELDESKDKYIRLYSEFENFRRRTAKERLELVKTANEDLVVALLPVLDDFERAKKSFGNNKEKGDIKATIEGFQLIQNKFYKIMEQKGLKPMPDNPGIDFDPEVHEAITKIPAPDDKLKGKVVDVVEKGYLLNDKVIRFAKVVIGS